MVANDLISIERNVTAIPYRDDTRLKLATIASGSHNQTYFDLHL